MTASFAFGQLIGPLTALVATGKNIWFALLPVSAIVLLMGWRATLATVSTSTIIKSCLNHFNGAIKNNQTVSNQTIELLQNHRCIENRQ